jgi:hypothetical protein
MSHTLDQSSQQSQLTYFQADLIVSAFGGNMPSQDPGLPYGVSENDIGGPHPQEDPDKRLDRIERLVRWSAREIAEAWDKGENVNDFLNDLCD